MPFFWLTNAIVMNSAISARRRLEWATFALDALQKRIPESVMTFVWPGVGVRVNLQDPIAKKKAPQMLAAWV